MAVLGLAALNLSAQTPAELGIQTYAGLTITGTVATVYSIEYVTDLAQSNNAAAWRCLEYLQLPTSPYLWADKSAPATGKRFYRAVAMPAPTNLVFIAPGTFRMGSPTNEVDRDNNEGPQTAVTLTKGFWMGRCEVTQGDYLAVMGNNPSWFNGVQYEGGDWEVDYGHDLSRPVEEVTWFDATAYCEALTQRELAAGRIGTHAAYRLPTEAEWEYACRAGTSTRFSCGDDPGDTNLTNYAWYVMNSDLTVHPVGHKLPNSWGLHDMHGNVAEWCQDWYGDYLGGIASDPQGPATGSHRVIRNGHWITVAGDCRSARRARGDPGGRGERLGFRVVLAPGQP
jgi:formylglycine-generating enzyme required for sulfatase activity